VCGLPLEEHFQGELHQARILSTFDSAKIGSICAVAVRVGKLRVIEEIEEFRAEFETSLFSQCRDFVQNEIEVVQRGPQQMVRLAVPMRPNNVGSAVVSSVKADGSN
jgi:hypothetical protein